MKQKKINSKPKTHSTLPTPKAKKSLLLPIILIATVVLVGGGGYIAVLAAKNQARNKAYESINNDNAPKTPSKKEPSTIRPTNEPAPKIKPQIGTQKAMENVKNSPIVKQYLIDNPSAKIDLYSTDNDLHAYIFHVYQQTSNTIKTQDWYEANYTTGEVRSMTKENPCPKDPGWMCLQSSFFNDEYTLPAGWNASLSLFNSWGSDSGYQSIVESLDIKKGDYIVRKYENRSTGRAYCIDSKDDLDNFVLLNNDNLTYSFLLRNKEPDSVFNEETMDIDKNRQRFRFCAGVTGKRRNKSEINLDDVCFPNESNPDNNCIEIYDGETLMGAIKYDVPKNPDMDVIKEMDLIVESLRK